jgi:pimeloyl-ACP methyl ester carboxylesterase
MTGAAERSFDLLCSWPDLLAVDLSADVPRVQVPVYFAIGRYDRLAPPPRSRGSTSMRSWAPRKKWIEFEDSAHFPQWEQAEKFGELLTGRVLPGGRGLALASAVALRVRTRTQG